MKKVRLKKSHSNTMFREYRKIYLDKKCGSSPGTWLVGKLFMESSNGEICVGQVLHRLPRQVRTVVTHPIHLVLKFAAEKMGIHDEIDLKLWKAIHLGRERGGHDAIWERVRHMRFQEADMEHRMDMHGCGRGQAMGRSTNLANDSVGAKSTNIQFG